MSPAALAAHWERRLRREGLAPIDQRLRRRVIVRTEIITLKRRYLPDADRLAFALELWLSGDSSGFARDGLALLARRPAEGWGQKPGYRAMTPRRRARILLRICRELADGKTIHDAARTRGDSDVAYEYLRPLYRTLAENFPRDEEEDDAPC